MPERISFDALTLFGVVQEAQALVGARVDRVRQADDSTLLLQTQAGTLLISCDTRAPRAHLSFARGEQPAGFLRLLKDRLEEKRISAIKQVGFDRRLSIDVGDYELVADLLGTRANLTLLGRSGAVGQLRKITPPSANAPNSLEEAVDQVDGLSKTLRREIEAVGTEKVLARAEQIAPTYYSGIGAYPFPLESVSAKPMPMASLSQALEKHYSDLIPALDAEALQRTLRGQLAQAEKARGKTLAQIEEVLDTASRARKLQMFGELILAYPTPGVDKLLCDDYDGNPVEIAVDPDKTAPENADRYFQKAKKAKNAAQDLIPKAARLRKEIEEIHNLLATIDDDPAQTAASAKSLGLLREQQLPPEKREIVHQGHRVRETEIDGYTVFWGENATANDYVTTRIAKPNDYWLHVRGAHGSHVVLRTNNKPENIPKPVLEKAAIIAAKNSNQKHARHVPVTITLAKHVRKLRKSAPGAVTFTNDKTLFVDP